MAQVPRGLARTAQITRLNWNARPARNARLYIGAASRTIDGPSSAAPAGPESASHEPLTLPLNFYSVLHLNRASSREAVKRAYEKVINSPPDVGYSQDTLFSRAVLLKSAAECLADLDARRAYDAAAAAVGGEHTLDVSRDNLPGALVLLQEAGESALVVELGRRWLEDARAAGGAPPPAAADVAATAALALCDLAAAALEEEAGQVLGACERLEEALGLLQAHGLAPQLQQQIEDTLEVSARGGDACAAGVSCAIVSCCGGAAVCFPSARPVKRPCGKHVFCVVVCVFVMLVR
jgi:hypothetical protein